MYVFHPFLDEKLFAGLRCGKKMSQSHRQTTEQVLTAALTKHINFAMPHYLKLSPQDIKHLVGNVTEYVYCIGFLT
jgi:hypothetical protein